MTAVAVNGCPCGRSHPTQGKPHSVRRPSDTARLVEALYDQGVTVADADDTGRMPLHYAGNCQRPVVMKQNDVTRLFTATAVRCRRCKACLEARKYHWGRRAERETALCAAAGLRTWFGTLTFRPDANVELQHRAWSRLGEIPEWFEQTEKRSYFCEKRQRRIEYEAYVCDRRFELMRDEALDEVKKFWKRLRNSGHKFSYLCVFERHRSGEPHVHFLLHEKVAPIRKRELQAHWPLGHTNVSIVGGSSARSAAPDKAAWYVVKYLSKAVQARQVASLRYGK